MQIMQYAHDLIPYFWLHVIYIICHVYTVKSVLSSHSKIDKTKVLKTNGSLMKVKTIAECSPWSILQYF